MSMYNFFSSLLYGWLSEWLLSLSVKVHAAKTGNKKRIFVTLFFIVTCGCLCVRDS